jgi:hypothetical protein
MTQAILKYKYKEVTLTLSINNQLQLCNHNCFGSAPFGIVLTGSILVQTSAMTVGRAPKHAIHLLCSAMPSKHLILHERIGCAARIKWISGKMNFMIVVLGVETRMGEGTGYYREASTVDCSM